MREFRSFRSRGQTAILVALVGIAVVAFVALAVDGGNAYSLRRQAQNAADGGAIAGTWVMIEYSGVDPDGDILRKVNAYVEANGVPDTNGVPGDVTNDNLKAYYIDYDGNRLQHGSDDWELHMQVGILPGNARGIEVVTSISNTTFFARAIGVPEVAASALAAANYQPDGGILPIAVNEYWEPSKGCPYDNCGPPYSFVRDPGQLPPFSEDPPGSDEWVRNLSSDPYNDYTSQGAYQGYSENFGRAFAILGADAKPTQTPADTRSAVELDYRYDALLEGGMWHTLLASDTWQHDTSPIAEGQGKAAMEAVILSGGYDKIPLPRALHEPPPDYGHISDWGWCWDTPPNDENCFNHPETGRSAPYDMLQFLSGASARFLAKAMHDNNYAEGRYPPGQRIVIMVYDGYFGASWGNTDVAPVVGYFGAVIVGYGNHYANNCPCDPFDLECFQGCVGGQANTTYGMVAPGGQLVIDPTKLLEEFLPKKISLIK